MFSIRTTVAAVAVTAVAVTALAGSGLALAGGADAAGKKHSITGLSASVAGLPLGKGFAGIDSLATHGGKPIGFDTVAGHATASGGTHLDGALSLKGGMIYYTLDLPDGTSGTGKVLGGTGKYQGAKGTVEAHVQGDGGVVDSTVVWWK